MFRPRLEHCPLCGESFWQDEPWKNLCFSCWKEQRQAEYRVGVDPDVLRSLRERADFFEGEYYEAQGVIAYLERQQTTSNLDRLKDYLPDLIFLTHPDKHGNSEKATKVTQCLLELRKEVGR